jgi:hypothetical protein
VDELDKELKTLKRGTRRGARRWPSKLLLQLLVEVGTLANSSEDIDPSWTVVTANLVSIYRSEQAKKNTIDNYVPPSAEKPTKGPLIPDDED